MDANFYANVSGATANGEKLSEVMPAYREYLDSLPSVHDLFKGVRKSKSGLPVVYDDSKVNIKDREAYVFKPVNEENSFEKIDLSKILA